MASLTFSAESGRNIERLVARFADRFPDAIVRALNRAGVTTRAVMAREIVKELGAVKVGDVKERIHIEKAVRATMRVRLSLSGKRIPLIDFGATGPRPSRGRGRGVTSRLRGGTRSLPDAFIAQVGIGAHVGVFTRDPRRGASRRKSKGAWSKNLPISQLFGPSLPRVFGKVSPAGLEAGAASLVTNLRSELRFALGGGRSE